MTTRTRLRSVARSSLLSFALIAAPLAYAACGGDDTVVPQDAGAKKDSGADGTVGDAPSGNDAGDGGATTDTNPAQPVAVQILAFNDFHGNIDPPTGGGGKILAGGGDPQAGDAGVPVDGGNQLVPAGGAAYLATHLARLRQRNPNTVVVSAGDMTGASPLVSALFHDEPSILVMNKIGVDFNGVGNHEFDHGVAELLRLQNGGCHPVDGCVGSTFFPGASFQYLAANVDVSPSRTLFPRYGIKQIGGAKIAFIGMTLEGTPGIVIPSAVAGLTFEAEVATVNKLVPELRQQGASAIIVLVHEGGFPTGLYNECPGLSGAINAIVQGLDPAVDVVVSAHTHQAYNCTMNGKLLTSAASFGRLVTSIDLVVDPVAHAVTSKKANNVIITRNVAPDPDVQSILATYTALAAPLANRVIGHVTASLSALPNAAGESQMGDAIADAMLAATSKPAFGGAVIAFMNIGGVRADLTYQAPNGPVTYASAFTVQPFGNSLVTVTLTGDQLHTALEQQFSASGQAKILQPSTGFTYTWNSAAAVGAKVDPTTMKLNGVTIDPAASYRVTVNSFVASGGDAFKVFALGSGRLGGAVDLDAMVAYLGANDPLAPPASVRIVMQ